MKFNRIPTTEQIEHALRQFHQQHQTKALALMGAVIAGGASAQTAATGTGAVTGLGLDAMITAAGEGIRAIISGNAGPLMLAVLPVMAFFFIWGRVRSLF